MSHSTVELSGEQIQVICCAHGFKARPQENGELDLNPYVYTAVRACIRAELAALRGEVAGLRKDAERYRKVRLLDWNSADMCVVRLPKQAVKLGYDCPSRTRLDEFVDAIDTAKETP